MILIDRYDVPHPINCLADAKTMDGFMYYDLQQRDFYSTNLTAIVEMQSSALTIEYDSNFIHLPVDWYVIICDKMSGSIDTIQVHELTNTNFKLFVTGAKVRTVTEVGYRVVNFDHSRTFFYPVCTKQQMLCVAISPSKWILSTPNDSYQKYLKHMCAADLMM